MFQRLLKFVILSSSMLFFPLAAFAGDEKGNGGGGIQQDGVYMTFGTANLNFLADATALDVNDVPGLQEALAALGGLPGSLTRKAELIQDMIPYGARRYQNVLAIDNETLSALKNEYARLTGQSTETIAIFALTDTKTRVTYLLPTFYKLKRNEQAAILFHETCWILNGKLNYQQIVRAEIAFQRYLDARAAGSYEKSFGDALATLFNDYSISLNLDFAYDLDAGNLAGLGATAQGLPAKSLVPAEFLNTACFDYKPMQCDYFVFGEPALNVFLFGLIMNHPKSFFLRRLVNFLNPDQQGLVGLLYMIPEKPTLTFKDRKTNLSDYQGAMITSVRPGCKGATPADCDFHLFFPGRAVLFDIHGH